MACCEGVHAGGPPRGPRGEQPADAGQHRSRTSASATHSTVPVDDLGLVEVVPEAAEDQRRRDRPRRSATPTVTSATVETVASRSAGEDAGQRQRQFDPQQPGRPAVPMPAAASRTSAGHLAAARPARCGRDQQRVQHQRDRGPVVALVPRTGRATRAGPATGSCRARRRVRESAPASGRTQYASTASGRATTSRDQHRLRGDARRDRAARRGSCRSCPGRTARRTTDCPAVGRGSPGGRTYVDATAITGAQPQRGVDHPGGLGKVYPDGTVAVGDLSLEVAGRRAGRADRPVRLRQVDRAADDQPADRADQRPDPARRRGRHRASTRSSCAGASAT